MSDPVSDLKHELLAAAERRQGHAPLPSGRRRSRGRPGGGYRLLLISATLAIATAVGLLVTSPWSSSPGFLERAEAALRAPAGTVLHQKWVLTTTSTEPACTVRRGPSEIWIDQTPPHRYRVLLRTVPPPDAADDPRTLACSSWKGIELGGALDSGETLRFVPPNTLRASSGRFSYPLDLVKDLRGSISAGSAHVEGTTRFGGRKVVRIRVDPESPCSFPGCPRKPFYWYVDPKTFYPVAAEGAGGLKRLGRPFVPFHVVVRFLAYEYLSRTAANLALTDIRAQHPNATER
jgi:hypothetical protein